MRFFLQPLQPAHVTRDGAPTRRSQRLTIMTTIFVVVCASVFATFAASPSDSSATPLASKQAQARELNEQVSKLEYEYDELQERYRGARYELDQVRGEVRRAHREVVQTRADLKTSQIRLRDRAVSIYRDGNQTSTLEQFVVSGSISGFFDRIETVRRVGEQDQNVLIQVKQLNERVEREERALRAAQKRAAKVVKRAEKDKRKMGDILSARQAKLSSVNADIRQIMQRQREAELARNAAAARATSDVPASDSSASGSSENNPVVPLPPGSSVAAAAAQYAMGRIGSPYVWAASGPNSFDCSGLVMWAFAQAGRSGMPHSSYALAGMGVDVPLSQLQVGDLVFPSHDGHVGIYVGGGSFVHAPSSGDVVKVTSMSYYSIAHARRV
jgi:cell wall-associated NlpC family hydrolase